MGGITRTIGKRAPPSGDSSRSNTRGMAPPHGASNPKKREPRIIHGALVSEAGRRMLLLVCTNMKDAVKAVIHSSFINRLK